ncbi:hypothetical protein DPSP01_010936 [Paraphaeosphaeria sporulosa]
MNRVAGRAEQTFVEAQNPFNHINGQLPRMYARDVYLHHEKSQAAHDTGLLATPVVAAIVVAWISCMIMPGRRSQTGRLVDADDHLHLPEQLYLPRKASPLNEVLTLFDEQRRAPQNWASAR